jgi:hypothetical protein
MLFACDACGHPAVVLPDELHDNALVCCQGCRTPIATWAVFKQRTTRAILAAAGSSAPAEALSPDPLDPDLLRMRNAFITAA